MPEEDIVHDMNEQPQAELNQSNRSMKKEVVLWILVGLAVAGLVGLGAFVAYQNSQLANVSSSMNKITAKLEGLSQQPAVTTSQATSTESVEKPPEEFQTVSQKMADQIQIAHVCKGQMKEIYLFGDERRPAAYCLGENRLLIVQKASEPQILLSQNITEEANAPILIKTELVPSSGMILISYAPEPCSTVGDCGVGAPTNYVKMVYNPKDGQTKTLSKYPTDGSPVWNPSGTKAIFVPNTCGGAGCQAIPLIGYDLTRDATQSVTTETAVGTKENKAQDAAGKPLPIWGSIQWKNDSDFAANLIKIDASSQAVTGKF